MHWHKCDTICSNNRSKYNDTYFFHPLYPIHSVIFKHCLISIITLEKTVHIFRLLFENMNDYLSNPENTEDFLALTAMIGYVQKNYPNKIVLKDISSAGNCCKTKCTSLFQKYLTTSPMLYLSQYRLEKATVLPRNTSLTVTEIAYACGFSNTSYFCELFRKYYDTTPGKYRKTDSAYH